MPIYEYRCEACREHFEALVYASTQVACPACGSAKIEKQFSTFAVGGHTPVGPADCDIAQGGG